MPTPTSTLQIPGLSKRRMAALLNRARHLGMTPQAYLKHLVEEDLAISERAKTTSFAELLDPGQEVDDEELGRLVEAARNDYYRSKSRKE